MAEISLAASPPLIPSGTQPHQSHRWGGVSLIRWSQVVGSPLATGQGLGLPFGHMTSGVRRLLRRSGRYVRFAAGGGLCFARLQVLPHSAYRRHQAGPSYWPSHSALPPNRRPNCLPKRYTESTKTKRRQPPKGAIPDWFGGAIRRIQMRDHVAQGLDTQMVYMMRDKHLAHFCSASAQQVWACVQVVHTLSTSNGIKHLGDFCSASACKSVTLTVTNRFKICG